MSGKYESKQNYYKVVNDVIISNIHKLQMAFLSWNVNGMISPDENGMPSFVF